MKTVILLRHAEAYPTEFSGYDHERPLSVVGWSQVEKIRRIYADLWPSVDLIICSTRKRTLQTLQALETALRPDVCKMMDHRLHTATGEDLLDLIHWAPDWVQTLLIVGHNPGLTQCCHLLDPNTSIGTLDTCGVAVFPSSRANTEETDDEVEASSSSLS